MYENLPIMISLCLMLSKTCYTQAYAGIIAIGLGLYDTGLDWIIMVQYTREPVNICAYIMR